MFIITNHARERWVERIVNPDRYLHLRTCKGCPTCMSMTNEIKELVARVKGLDREIAKDFSRATLVTDFSFLEAVKKLHGDSSSLKFYVFKKSLFAIKEEALDKKILKTIMTTDMIDQTVIHVANEINEVFDRWKFEARQKPKGPIKRI